MKILLTIFGTLLSMTVIGQINFGFFMTGIGDNTTLNVESGIVAAREFRNLKTGWGTIPTLEYGMELGILTDAFAKGTQRGERVTDNLRVFAKPYLLMQIHPKIGLFMGIESYNFRSGGALLAFWQKQVDNVKARVGFATNTKDGGRVQMQVIWFFNKKEKEDYITQ